MRPSHPAVDAAVRFLRAGIERGIFGDGGRLPTMVELARCADVSKVSMTKAVAILVEEGLLDARRRRGILLRRHQPEPVPTPRTPSKAEAVAQDILRKYLRGVYGSNHVFGSLKELQASYGASFRTLKRALESLRRDGVIVPYGRGYRMRGPVPTPQPKTLVLF
ncbi:MAG TPA: GntR family transcriptional regulator, partial [Polyangiaceae bacterium]|nr:GntR family transcriptional regulator [Polyangiaceae bacterium]